MKKQQKRVLLMNRKELLQRCVEYLEKQEAIKLALVYGSVASDQCDENSDIDIAIAGSVDTNDLLVYRRDLELLCKRDIDLIDLRSAEGIILHRILTRGIRIKNDTELFVLYLKKALYYMEDFYPLQKHVQNTGIRRFING
jgi:uncharacterized protein